MEQIHLFVTDPVEKLNFQLDSSLRMAKALANLGAEWYFTQVDRLYWKSPHNVASAYVQKTSFSQGIKPELGSPVRMGLEQFHAIHMRKEPPVDTRFLATTHFFDSAEREGTLVFNSAQALRSINEKTSVMMFPELSVPALISASLSEAWDFIEEACDGHAVIKPLDLFGGKGIFEINKKDSKRLQEQSKNLEQALENGQFRMIQPFQDAIREGEVRVFTAGGKAISWCLKKPAPGNFLANTSAGAELFPYTPTERDLHVIESVAKGLLKKGVFLIGFDMIGGLISEINITSPRLLAVGDQEEALYVDIAKKLMTATDSRSMV